MLEILGVTAGVLLVTLWSLRTARRQGCPTLRPADEWTADDVDYWLDLIEPFPLSSRDTVP